MKRLFAWILTFVLLIGNLPILPVHAEGAEQPGTEETIILPEETEPEVTEPVVTEPEVTEPSTPETTDPTEPEVTEPVEPEVTEPTEPETTEPTDPQDGEEPNQDDTAAEEIPEGLEYTVGEDGVTITKYKGSATEVIIPAEIEGKPVVAIGDYAFYYNWDLERAVVPRYVTSIGKFAFSDCFALSYVSLPDGLVSVGDSAFSCRSNSACLSISMPNSVTCLGEGVFAYRNIDSFVIPTGVTVISKSLFYGSTISSVTIHDKVTSIGESAFASCGKLKSINIPESVTDIGESAFAFSGLRSLEIPKSITHINSYTFRGCPLRRLTIPSSLKTADKYAFDSCSHIEEIYIEDLVSWLSIEWSYSGHPLDYRYNIKKNKKLYVNDELITELVIPDEITSIPAFAFACFENIETIVFPDHEVVLCGETFSYCTGLTKVVIPNTVKEIGPGIFEGCSNLSFVYLSEHIKKIPRYVFRYCDSLETLYIPAGVKTIEQAAFDGCDGLKCIIYGGSVEELYAVEIDGLNEPLYNVGWHCEASCCQAKATISSDFVSGKPKLSWNSFPCVSAWGIYRSKSQKNGFALIDVVSETTYIDDSAVAGQKYYYIVAGITPLGEIGSASKTVGVYCRHAQTTISIERSEQSGKPVISWDKVDGAKNYELFRATSETGKYSKVKTTTATTYEDTTAKPGTTYYYKVRAKAASSSAHSQFSNVVSMLTICAQPVVKATVNSTTGQPSLSWKKVTGASKYEVYRATEAAGEYQLLATQKAVTFLDTTAAGDTQYYYKVKAISTKASANSTDMTPVAICSAMAQPVITVGNTAEGAPKITWDAVSNAVSYRVIRSTSQKGTYTEVGTTTETAFVDVTAQTGALYYYKVMAVGKVSESVPSAYKSTSACCESPVIGSDVQASTGKPMIYWNAVEGAKKYEVYRAASENGKYKKLKTVTALAYTDTTAKPGTTYYYKVMAVPASTAAKSIASNIVSVKCICAQPVVKISVNSTTGQPNLSWKKIAGASKYNIYRSTSENGEFELLATQKGVSFKDTTAAGDSTYYYRVDVVPVKEGAQNIPAAPVKVTSGLSKPVIKAVADEETGKPAISWDAVNGATQYRVLRSVKKGSGYAEVGVTSELRFVDSSAVTGKTYYYKVVAIGQIRESVPSGYKRICSR